VSKLLLFALLFSKDTIITTLAPASLVQPAASPTKNGSHPATAPVILQLLNTSATPLRNVTLDWLLQSNGVVIKTGKARVPAIPANQTRSLLPGLRMPTDTSGETFLILRYSSKPSGPPLAECRILLKPWLPRLAIPPAGELTLADENDIVSIRSPAIRISFNRQTGWLMQYEVNGIKLLDDTIGLRSNFWTPGYNDSANGPGRWMAATRDPHLQLFSNTAMPRLIKIRTEYTLPATTSLLHLSYVVNATGEMLVTQEVEPDTTQAPAGDWPMPCFGMIWMLPPGFDTVTRYGLLGSGSTGISRERTPVGSDLLHLSSTRTGIRWWTITGKDGNGVQFIADTTLLNERTIGRQVHIDHPTALSPDRRPDPLPGGNYRYTYKVKPLVNSR